MKAIRTLISLCLFLCLCLPANAETAAESRIGNVILYTAYRQMGWGDRIEIGCLDDLGQAFIIEGHSSLNWPYQLQDQLAWLQSREDMTCIGKISRDDLASIKSLITAAGDQGTKASPGACDAGTEATWAIRRSRDGTESFILLGMSGDDVFENTDPNAQSLYWCARVLFPNVTSYAYQSDGIGPTGFTPVSLLSRLNVSEADIRQGTITAYNIDCEEGLIDLPLTPEEEQGIRDLILHGRIIRKANALQYTGGMSAYNFSDANGKLLCSLELYDGLLVTGDGQYILSMDL